MTVKLPGWLSSSWAKVIGAVGVYGTLAGLGLLPLPAAAIAIVAGLLTNNLVPALAIGLALSLLVNVIQFAFLRRRGRYGSRRRLPSAFTVPGDLSTLTLTSEILESWWAYALTLVREKVGPDVNAYVASVDIHPVTSLSIWGESRAAMKKFDVRVVGTREGHVHWGTIHKIEKVRELYPEPLWRTDGTWRDLVEAAWVRERPTIRGSVTLYERNERGRRSWELVFTQFLTDDEVMMPGRFYSLDGDELKVHRV
jgi:hypothetical protein